MSKADRTRDELVRNFSEASAPPNTFASSAASSRLNSTYPVEDVGENNSVEVAPVAGLRTVSEYHAKESGLPMQVSQAALLAENDARIGNVGPSKGAGPMLAGTAVEESDNE